MGGTAASPAHITLINPPPPPQVLINKKKALKEKYTCIQKHHDTNISSTKPTHKISSNRGAVWCSFLRSNEISVVFEFLK